MPQSCVLCGALNCSAGLCGVCHRDLPRLRGPCCPRCALPTDGKMCGNCLKKTPAFENVVSALIYTFPVDALIQSLKYHGNLALGAVLANTLVEVIPPGTKPDLLIPVPLTRERQRERGFNQATEIAKIIARRLHIPVAADVCFRVRNTPPQVLLPWKERAKNIRGAFACRADFQGKKIAVVDDVLTTGSTLNELAKLLRRQGASEVSAWVVARTLPF